MFEPGFFSSFLQVIMIDLVLAGDNAVVIGLAAAGLPPDLRRKAILIGIAAATLMRIGFALIATQLLDITGLLLRRRPAAALGVLEDVRGAARPSDTPRPMRSKRSRRAI